MEAKTRMVATKTGRHGAIVVGCGAVVATGRRVIVHRALTLAPVYLPLSLSLAHNTLPHRAPAHTSFLVFDASSSG